MDDFASALDAAAAIRAPGRIALGVLDETLRRIDERNPALNAVIWRDDDDARRRADGATDRLSAADPAELPPFLGVPIAIKDLDHVAGWPATYGSNGASTEPRTDSALVVQAFERAGFVLCGRTNTPEFGSITATENVRYGITRNPWNTDHTSGGSSGGASAATASGMFALGHANDGGGSIRIPASCTGLVGLKPSRGRVPGETVAWEGAAVQGAVTRTVADTAAVLDVIAGPDPLSWWNAPPPARPFLSEVGVEPARLRVAAMTTSMVDAPVDPECVAAVEATLAALADAGHEVVDAQIGFGVEEFMAHFGAVVNAGLADYDVDVDRVEPHNRRGYETARHVDSLTYARAVHGLQTWTRTFNAQWGRDFDVLVTPTMPIQPPPAVRILAEVQADPNEVSPTVVQSVAFTAVFNVNGLPAISLPLHVAADSGLPIGVQVVGGPFDDAGVLRVAAQLETLRPWVDRHPV